LDFLVAGVSSALPWLLFSLAILEFQGLIQHSEQLKMLTPTDLRDEIFTIQWLMKGSLLTRVELEVSGKGFLVPKRFV
jgi:hypothetical protein